MKRAISSYLLIVLTIFQVISAVPAGVLLIIDPSGKKLGLPIELIESTPFPDFLIPGLFLFIVLGVFPIIIAYGLIRKNDFKLLEKINIYKKYHWSWACAYYLGLLLILWINIELYFIQDFGMLHFAFTMIGVLIIILAHLPATKRDYLKS
jgi:hypothetical protein